MQSKNHLVACPSCDLVLAETKPKNKTTVLCPRCGQILHRSKRKSPEKTCALSLTGLLLFIPAMFTPLLTLGILGDVTRISLAASIYKLFVDLHFLVGTVVFFTAFALPFFLLISLFTVSLSLLTHTEHPLFPHLFRYFVHLKEWAMTDVYLLGILIAIIKLIHSGSLTFNIGFFCFIGMVVVTLAAQSAVDHRLFWSCLETEESSRLHVPALFSTTAARHDKGYLVCHTCHKIFWQLSPDQLTHCTRCGETLHKRKKDSLQRTWALICTAIILTVPANVLPIMEVRYFGLPERSTILDGILYFFKEGSYGIGMIIFIASILVPLFKILGLLIILVSIHMRWHRGQKRKTAMYRFISFIGRWSMLDVFVITLMCTLVQFGFLSNIELAPAAVYFTGVVMSTMVAAITFDTRLVWDDTPAK